MKSKTALITLALTALFAASADAGLIISALPSNTGVAQIMITSDSSDEVADFTVVFDILPNPLNPIPPISSLEFVGASSYLTCPSLNDPDYIFYGASLDYDSGSVLGSISDPNGWGFNTEFSGQDIYDGAASSGSVSVASGTSFVLANLILAYTATGTTNPPGDIFNLVISLNPGKSAFHDGAGNLLTINNTNPILANATVYTSGAISIVPVLPEPSSIVMSLIAIIGGFVHSRRQPRPA